MTNNRRTFVVVHPLDDVVEAKVDVEALGPMPLTPSVKFSLLVLRGYLIIMGLLVLYHQLFWGATDNDLLREIRAGGYGGRVVSGKDLDVY